MKVGIITKPNQKGQIVIPKEYRDALGINEKVPLNIILRDQALFIYPVIDVTTATERREQDFLEILKKTKGVWAGDSWEETQKKRRKIELEAAKKRRGKKW